MHSPFWHTALPAIITTVYPRTQQLCDQQFEYNAYTAQHGSFWCNTQHSWWENVSCGLNKTRFLSERCRHNISLANYHIKWARFSFNQTSLNGKRQPVYLRWKDSADPDLWIRDLQHSSSAILVLPLPRPFDLKILWVHLCPPVLLRCKFGEIPQAVCTVLCIRSRRNGWRQTEMYTAQKQNEFGS